MLLQVAEISRVLKPGAVFVASTFLKASAPLGQLFNNDDIFRPLNAVCLCNQQYLHCERSVSHAKFSKLIRAMP